MVLNKISHAKGPLEEPVVMQSNIRNYVVLSNPIDLPKDDIESKDLMWHMSSDGAFSKPSKGVRIVFISSLGHIFKFSFRLEFEATNNVAEYEALLLGLEIARELRIKLLTVKGDSDLVIKQVKGIFSCKSDRLRKYRNVLRDTIELFDTFGLHIVPREEKCQPDEIAVAISTFQISDNLLKDRAGMEVIFKPSVPDNVEHWQIFYDEKQIVCFLNHLDEFESFQ